MNKLLESRPLQRLTDKPRAAILMMLRRRSFARPTEVQPKTDLSSQKEEVRLPTNYTVDTYTYKQTPDFDRLTFSGEETIVMTVTEPSQELTFNALGLDIASAAFKTADGQLHPASITYDTEEQRVTFGFDTTLEGKGELDLSFTGDFKDNSGKIKAELNGTHLVQWQDTEGATHYWATSQYEPTDARRALVVADEPDRKASFAITLVTPHGWEAISNMPERDVYTQDGQDVHVFEPTPKMSPYLLANIVGEFDTIQATDRNGKQHRVITTPGKGEQGRMALEVSQEVLPFYEDWTGIPFPLPKQDNIAVPQFDAGAMENWGAITFREQRLLVDPTNSSQATKEGVVEVVGHEEAHMWFGNLVSPKWWTYLWLNESFATYMSYLASDHVHPEWKVWDKFVNDEQNTSLQVDSLKSTHPIEVQVNHPREIGEIFDTISYHKGCSVLDMLSDYISPENFRKGTSKYLKKHANGNATTQDLLESYEEVSGLPVREVMENWLHQPGHPVITVKDMGGHFELSQERFFINPRSADQAQDTTVWQIPLHVHEEGRDPRFVMMKDKVNSIRKTGNGNWFLVNEGSHGFVRVAYPPSLLRALAEPIEQQQIGAADRYALIRDAFDLAQAGISPTVNALEFVGAYKHETNVGVWTAIAEKFGNVANIIDSESPQTKAAFDAFAQSLFRPLVEKMGWEKKPGESNKDTLLRELAITNLGAYGDPETKRIAHEKFEAHVSGESLLDPDLRGAVYKIVASTGNETEYEQLMQLYKATNLKEEQARILVSLGAFSQPELIEKTLQFVLPTQAGGESADKAEAFKLMAALFHNPSARDKAWEFTKEHWDTILEMYGESQLMLPRFISPAAQFHSLEKARDIEEFFATHEAPGGERMVGQVIETIVSKAAWLQRDGDAIGTFLQNQAA